MENKIETNVANGMWSGIMGLDLTNGGPFCRSPEQEDDITLGSILATVNIIVLRK